MDTQNGSCAQNLTDAAIQHGALTTAAPGIACLLLNLVGLSAEFIFICVKKNTFLLRLYVYMSIAVTMSVGGYSSFILMYFWPENDFLCKVTHTVLQYSAAVEVSLVFSISIILLCKVGNSCRLSQGTSVLMGRISKSKRNCLEALFIAFIFSIPAVALSAFLGIEHEAGICFTIKHSLECYIEKRYVLIEVLAFETIPVLLDSVVGLLCVCVLLVWLCWSVVGLLCVCVLLVWLCWLRTRLYLKARMKTVIQEIGAWLGFLVIYCLAAVLIEISDYTNNSVIKFIAFLSYPLLHSCVPVLFFIYMFVNLCPSCRKKLVRHKVVQRRPQSTVQTDWLQTTPKSSRISLPTDTVAHAPDFLSPIEEEFTEVSPLLT